MVLPAQRSGRFRGRVWSFVIRQLTSAGLVVRTVVCLAQSRVLAEEPRAVRLLPPRRGEGSMLSGYLPSLVRGVARETTWRSAYPSRVACAPSRRRATPWAEPTTVVPGGAARPRRPLWTADRSERLDACHESIARAHRFREQWLPSGPKRTGAELVQTGAPLAQRSCMAIQCTAAACSSSSLWWPWTTSMHRIEASMTTLIHHDGRHGTRLA